MNSCLSEVNIKLINDFLSFEEKPIPYFRQIKKKGWLVPGYLIGKGKIEDKKKYSKMGIDCSGFICRVIEGSKPIRQIISDRGKSFMERVRFFLRPVENINVALLIDPINSFFVAPNQLQVGDLIHIGKKHVMLIFRISGSIVYYVHASEKQGCVAVQRIKKLEKKDLFKWNWEDDYYHKLFKKTPNSGVVRLRRWLIE